ncbi:MAG: DUF1553 domain-containing protein [Gemmataceae bacterium]|nr:DUF1553 domain-containing protein [Gemmataceae bacterium]
MSIKRVSRPWLLCGLVGLVLVGFVCLMTQPSDAQTGKADPKGKKAKDKSDPSEAKKEPKIEPPPSNFPARKDFIDPSAGGTEHVNLIDEHITKGWRDTKGKAITFPSDRCTDYEFIRRASLDIVGRIPTVGEIGKYMQQTESKRRSWLINEMLDGPAYGNGAQYAQNFANLWTILLMTRSGSNQHHKDQMNDWLYTQLKGEDKTKAPNWALTVKELIAGEGDTNTNQAVNYLLHNLGELITKDTDKNGKWDMIPATSRTTKLFLGIRTQCVQCHDHPFNGEWGQHHFWGINAFLRQSDSNGRPNPELVKKKKKGVMGNQEFSLKDNKNYNSNNLTPFERRNNVVLFTDPSFLDGKKIPKTFKGTRREKLADYVISSPYFSKAFVNRTWGHFFGKSFTKDNVDDFGEHNPVSHPELFDKLSEDWATNYGYNPKVLIRWICNSQAYGLSSRANKWNDKPDDETLFARMLLKPMTPEQMFESMVMATTIDLRKKEEKLAAKEAWLNKLVVNFGNDEGEEGVFTGTVVQALLLMNGADVNDAITAKDGAVAAIITKHGASQKSLPFAIQAMYMHVLGRPASPKEMADLQHPDRFMFVRKGSPTPNANQTQFWTNYYQDIMWALLNSNEFILNH